MWLLVLRPDAETAERHPLSGTHTLGRGDDNDIVIPDDSLSRRHAVLRLDGDRLFVEDVGSKNGTQVDDVAVAGPTELAPGSRLRFGTLPAVVEWEGIEAPWATSRSARATLPALLSGARGDADHRLSILLEVARLLGGTAGVPELLDRIASLTLDVLDVDVAVLELDEQRVWRSRDGAEPEVSRSVLDWVDQHRVAGLFADAALDQRLAGSRSVDALSIASSMAAPLLVDERQLGVLYADRRGPGARLAQPDLDLLAAFANQAALALDHAALHAQVTAQAVARDRLLRFFPPSVVAHLAEGGASMEAQQVEVTAMFCDISSYTALTADMAPTHVLALLNRYVSVVVPEIFARGGTLEKYAGDAVLAVWGAPVSSPDDPARAVEAALAIRDAVAALRLPSGPLQVHIGLHTGEVAAGNVGTPDFLQYVTVGAATNFAARLCGTAGDGEIVVSDDTWSRLGTGWDGERLPDASLKGFEGRFGRWRVDGRPALLR